MTPTITELLAEIEAKANECPVKDWIAVDKTVQNAARVGPLVADVYWHPDTRNFKAAERIAAFIACLNPTVALALVAAFREQAERIAELEDVFHDIAGWADAGSYLEKLALDALGFRSDNERRAARAALQPDTEGESNG